MTQTSEYVAAKARPPITTLALIVLTLGVYQLGAVGWSHVRSSNYPDFPVLHGSARALLNGQDLYFSGPTTRNGNRNLNPPHVIGLMAPLGAMSLQNAAFAGWAVIAVAIGAFFLACRRVFPHRPVPTVFAIALASAASSTAVSFINLGWVVAAGAAWAWIWARTGHHRRAAITLGCLASVKVFFLIFAPYWLWRRNWRYLLWSGGTVALVFVAGLAAVGVRSYQTWLMVLRDESPVGDVRSVLDASLQSIWMRLPVASEIQLTGWVISVGVIAAAAWWHLGQGDDTDRDWAIVLTTMLLVSPLGWIYYWLIPILPVAAVLSTRGPRWAARAGGLGILMPSIVLGAASSMLANSPLAVAVSSTYALVALAVWYSLLRQTHPKGWPRQGVTFQERIRR